MEVQGTNQALCRECFTSEVEDGVCGGGSGLEVCTTKVENLKQHFYVLLIQKDFLF